MEDILTQPVAMRRAVFWRVWSLWMEEGEALGNQIGDAYVNRDLMRDLYVIRRVSFCWPQLVPARAFRRLIRGAARDMIDEM